MESIFDTWAKEGGLVTINLAAQMIGISQQAVSEAVDKGKIKSHHIDKKRYVSYNDVLAYIAKRSARNAS
ncbi:MAG: helix-turn-helix domain-containing protein [Lentisphaeraceae bacterium]|nr:helix-turn-helix domain-containing protein [Lentisphaeraceae bacterium]